jgi:aflatoxin B1 aldehyde reductase
VHTTAEAAKIIDVFQQHGHKDIDTARIYGGGSSEEMLADLQWQQRALNMHTKLYPNARSAMQSHDTYSHKSEDIRRGLNDSLRALNCTKVDLFYLHGPDRITPFDETLREVNELYKEGRFNHFGISNYMSWEVAKICEICEKNGWIKPTVYQGLYHALQRNIEAELLPCLHHYGIALYAFQPLAGGFLTGRYQRTQTEFEPGSRFDPKILQGVVNHNRYWNDSYFDAMDIIRPLAEKHGFTVAEVALRWLEYHSELRNEHRDAIVVGASSVQHLVENLADLEKGPLPENLIREFETAWQKVKAVAPKYWH